MFAEQHRHFGIDTQSQQLHEHTIIHGELIPWVGGKVSTSEQKARGVYLVGGWTNPFEKYATVKLDHSPS